MTWQDDDIAGPMGYKYCVLFESARKAIWAYAGLYPLSKSFGFPTNMCPYVLEKLDPGDYDLLPVDNETGLAECDCHLYGYRQEYHGYEVEVDPLMTGWIQQSMASSAVVSFGLKKILSMGYGGAFLTSNQGLAQEMQKDAHWNDDYTDMLRVCLPLLKKWRLQRFDTIALWDRHLGDSLIRIPGEQIMPWRVMRKAHSRGERDDLVASLRSSGIAVGANYAPLAGRNKWGDTVLNFFCEPDMDESEIRRACEIVKQIVNPPFRIGIDG